MFKLPWGGRGIIHSEPTLSWPLSQESNIIMAGINKSAAAVDIQQPTECDLLLLLIAIKEPAIRSTPKYSIHKFRTRPFRSPWHSFGWPETYRVVVVGYFLIECIRRATTTINQPWATFTNSLRCSLFGYFVAKRLSPVRVSSVPGLNCSAKVRKSVD